MADSSDPDEEYHRQNYEEDQEEEGEEDDEGEDDSLSSAPPPPPIPDPVTKRSSKTKSKPIPTQVPPPNKKRKTQPNPPQSITPTDRSIYQNPTHHAPDSSQVLSTHPNPKSRATKHHQPATKAKSTRSQIAPLTDAELLSAAGSQYPTHHPGSPPPITSSSHPPPPASSKPPAKKKKSNPDGNKKRLAPPPNTSASAPNHASNSTLGQPPINQAIPSAQLITKPATVTKSKSKKSSKLSQPRTQPDPFQTTENSSGVAPPIVRPPPQPRPQHDYTLGPPPPPPVPAFKPFAVGPAPRAQGQFLPAQTLEKRTPKVRSWKKIKREVVGVSGIPFWLWTYAGDDHSDYASAKQSKVTQVVGTPSSTQDAQYVPLVPQLPQSRPASVASSHAKPSPNRTSAGPRLNNHKLNSATVDNHPNSSAGSGNLGGPVLPASFRRAPASIVGSPLGNNSINNN